MTAPGSAITPTITPAVRKFIIVAAALVVVFVAVAVIRNSAKVKSLASIGGD